MFEIRQVDLKDHPLETLSNYRSFLIPDALPHLKKPIDSEQFQFISSEAVMNNEIVGFILAKFFFSNQSVQLFSIFVTYLNRKKGIGTALFSKLQNQAKEMGARTMGFEYPSTDLSAPFMEKILLSQGWPKPLQYRVVCTFKVQDFHPCWFEKLTKKPIGLKTFPWRDVKCEEKKLITHQENQGTFPAYLSPMNNVVTLDPINSLGLRYKKKLIGWMITHRIDAETIRYTSLYVEREYLGSGYGIHLLAEAICRQQLSSVPLALFEVNLDHVDSSWIHFIKRRLIPFAQKVQRFNWAFNFTG